MNRSHANTKTLSVAMTKCFFCLEPDRIVMNQTLTEHHAKSVDALDGKVVDMQPCRSCEDLMKQGILLISIRDNEPHPEHGKMPNPYRTGGWTVVKEAAFVEVFSNASGERAVQDGLKYRFLFVEDSAWDKLGIPRDVEIDNRNVTPPEETGDAG